MIQKYEQILFFMAFLTFYLNKHDLLIICFCICDPFVAIIMSEYVN